MIEKHEIRSIKKAKESVLPRWFDAYVLANKRFPLIPTAIDACVGFEIFDSIISGNVSWGRLVHSKLSESQIESIEAVMTKMHRTFQIPLAGASQSGKEHGMTREMLKHFVHHHKRPTENHIYKMHPDETHMVVHPRVMHGTWRGIVGETARAAVVFGQVTGFDNPHIRSLNVHTSSRSSFLQRDTIRALDDVYGKQNNTHALHGLLRLYKAANAWGYSKQGLKIGEFHRSHFDLGKPHSKTPFEVTHHLREFNDGLENALHVEIEHLRKGGFFDKNINMQPFVQEMVKHGRLT